MAYTFQTKPTPTYSTTGQLDRFGNLPHAGSHDVVTGGGNGIQTVDATQTPVVSPVALTTAIKAINIPINACKINFIADGIVRVSESATQASYVTVPASTQLNMDVATQTVIYFAAATTANLSFWFSII